MTDEAGVLSNVGYSSILSGQSITPRVNRALHRAGPSAPNRSERWDLVSRMLPRRGYRRDGGSPQSSDSSAVNKGVDAETLEFIQKYLTSYTKWELLKHFAENPGMVETSKGFARRLGKDIRQIGDALKSLSRTGIISNGRGGESSGYALTADDGQKAMLMRIVDTVRVNNRFRLLLNYHITKASLAKYKSEHH